ncbi:FtsK/SpoIIIE domain-containing protein [Nocardia sp. NBC_00508]|uniref:FtsK/SpoIIIE domain-containing protein n=1 Tax=Nocardia sp. NBC_00508 TaxID=2975992 RepID=UPI002E80745B|nr:FtsK/SpoIIIE domain-containing protein [Nocardia sp. NBC_00508]WUD69893.1 FtsK/SpoIIIE domain-containing protein [Nocardia sp. NBC_00508]
MSVTATLVTAGAVVATGLMWQWRRIGAGGSPTPEDHAAAAPPELRTAAFIVTDPAQLALMWPALGLGSWQVGYPNVVSATYTAFGMSVEVQMLGGQSMKDWTNDNTRDALAHYFAVPSVTVSAIDPGFVRLDLRVYDTLADTASVPGSSGPVDLEAVPVGVTEDFDTWRLRVLYAHILLAGAMGSGKGSVLWSLIAALGPAIKAGLVDVWMADPKGGMEFGRGQRLWVRFEWTAEGILAMLNEAVTTMQERAARLREAGIRKLVPTPDEPLILIIIDEAAALSAYADREQQQEFQRLTGLLLSQGRAVGVSVIAALQDPSKETMPNRQLFPVRIGLRLDEPTQTTMVHGQGARDRGARCDEISEHTPGVGYVGEDGTTEFVRVRAFYVSDEDIDAIVDAYAPAPEITGPTEDYSNFDPDDLGDADGPVAA